MIYKTNLFLKVSAVKKKLSISSDDRLFRFSQNFDTLRVPDTADADNTSILSLSINIIY